MELHGGLLCSKASKGVDEMSKNPLSDLERDVVSAKFYTTGLQLLCPLVSKS